MPCRCDHMEPTKREEESVAVLGFLEEVGLREFGVVRWVDNPVPDNGVDYYRPKIKEVDEIGAYGNLKTLDADTAELCEYCKNNDISKHSLELQIWWRDHQIADMKREKREKEERFAQEKERMERSSFDRLKKRLSNSDLYLLRKYLK